MDQAIVIGRSTLAIRAGAVALGALLVAAAAQVAVPLPGTPVPMTLQPLAVLLVGGLLGARLGALSMILYLAMGIAGLPVFTPTVPLVGVARLMGPTGGYLLAYPVAAFVVGKFSDPGRKPGENPAGDHRSSPRGPEFRPAVQRSLRHGPDPADAHPHGRGDAHRYVHQVPSVRAAHQDGAGRGTRHRAAGGGG